MADINGDPWELRAYTYEAALAPGVSERRTAYELLADVDSGPDAHTIISEFYDAATPATLRLIEQAPELMELVAKFKEGCEYTGTGTISAGLLSCASEARQLLSYIENGDLPKPDDPIGEADRREGMAEDYGRDRRSGE